MVSAVLDPYRYGVLTVHLRAGTSATAILDRAKKARTMSEVNFMIEIVTEKDKLPSRPSDYKSTTRKSDRTFKLYQGRVQGDRSLVGKELEAIGFGVSRT
jgi:hypothetical protein